MNILQIRNELHHGKSVFDLPLRVTFYARVSTDKDAQLNSLENQIQYYTELIQSKPAWTYIPGYIDEGISGTSTKKRDSFLRMIQDAKSGQFDFIVTKEISRFSRSTLDSIHYTQELLEYNVGVLFQNDGINTLDSDSEFRLTIMAGVAQDEVRKLSERLKFGFHQAIKNGHVLGNDTLWGYNKQDCVLTVNEQEAAIIRRIFDLYANQQLGIRKISQKLYEEGITSRKGNPFNELTIRHILCNPKYKGWYCAGKSKTLDYRSKRKIFLDESQWIMYPDPSIPAIVSESLWDRANRLYKQRRQRTLTHQGPSPFQNRYPYSGKILCEIHNASYHRDVLKSSKGEKEIWLCRIYRKKGKAGCSSPQVSTAELNQVMAYIFNQLVPEKDKIIEFVLQIILAAFKGQTYHDRLLSLEKQADAIGGKKERLLEMSVEGALSITEFKEWNDNYNQKLRLLEEQRQELLHEEALRQVTPGKIAAIKTALEEELSFQGGVNSPLAAVLLEQAVVKKDSTKEKLHLDIHLKSGGIWTGIIDRKNLSFRFNPS